MGYYAEDGERILAGGRTEEDVLRKAKKKIEDEIAQVEQDFDDNKRTKIDMLKTRRALQEQLSNVELDLAVAERKSKQSKTREVPLKGMSVREKYEAIREGDEVHFIPKDNLPNFDRKIKVDFIRDGVPHYGLSETSDGHTYPFWAVKDIEEIIRKKNELELNGGKGSGNFGHSGRPGERGGSGSGKGNVPSKIEKFEKALTDYANGDDIISIMTHKDEWEKFEKWAKKERYTKDEWEKLLASLEFGEYARDIADM